MNENRRVQRQQLPFVSGEGSCRERQPLLNKNKVISSLKGCRGRLAFEYGISDGYY
jgi:hypothetical protein